MTRKGYSFTDLLVVFAIISILAVILFPIFAKVRDRSNQDVDVSNEMQIGAAISQYVQDNNGTYPMAAQYSATEFGGSFNPWVQAITPYVSSFSVFESPDDPNAGQTLPFPGGVGISYAINGITVNPTAGYLHLRGVSGFNNSWFGGGNCSPTDQSACGTDITAQQTTNIPRPAQTILLTNCFSENADNSLGSGINSPAMPLSTDFMGGGNGNPAPDDTGAGDYASSEEYPSGLETGSESNSLPYNGNNSAPYNGGTEADYLFADGHVQAMVPVNTNPDPVLKPSQNLWVCDRPDNDSLQVNWVQGPPPPAPTGLTATPGIAQVALTWSAAAGATAYSVLDSTTSSGPYTSTAVVSTTGYTKLKLTNGTTYYFMVAGINDSGAGPASADVSAVPMSPPPTPTGLTATPGNAQVALTWTPSTGATGYKALIATASGAPYRVAAFVSTPSYTKKGLTNGSTYYFAVAAIDSFGTSSNSTQVAAIPEPPPPAPTGLTATPGNALVRLSWSAVPAATDYRVLVSTVSGSGYHVAAIAPGTTYKKTGLTNGTTYYFAVAAVDPDGTSPDSTQVSAVPAVP